MSGYDPATERATVTRLLEEDRAYLRKLQARKSKPPRIRQDIEWVEMRIAQWEKVLEAPAL